MDCMSLVYLFWIYTLHTSRTSVADHHLKSVDPEPLPRYRREINDTEKLKTDVPTWQDTLGEGNSCLTSKGHLGSCTAFRTCYPYFKIPDLSVWESWVLGNYDACSYFNEQGKQAYGVCCTNPIPEPMEEKHTTTAYNYPNYPPLSNQNPYQQYPSVWQQFGQWPPMAPTHPPNHTPATHPPSHTTWPTLAPIGGSSTPVYHPISPTESPSGNPGKCGIKNSNPDQERIVGGHNASPQEWPWIAVLFHGHRQFCGASLITTTNLLSAAHCVAHMSAWDVARLTARLGDHNIQQDYEVQHIERKIKRVVRHRGFDSRTLYHDVSVLTMDFPIQYTPAIHPICLPQYGKDFSGMMATVIGWGSLRENGPQPALLQQVSIPIWSNIQCSQKYGTAAPAGINEGMICAGKTAKDSCSGDSGGPMMVKDHGKWVQAGIVSWGIGCGKGEYPGVYARVTYYLPWINKNLDS